MMSCNAAYGQGYGSGFTAASFPSAYYAQVNVYHVDRQQERHELGSQPTPGFCQIRQNKTLCRFFMQGNCTKGDACSFTHSYMGTDEAPMNHHFKHLDSSHSQATIQLSLDDFSDFSDSDDEELLDNPMKAKEFGGVGHLALPCTLSNWSACESDIEPMGEPSPGGAHEKSMDTAENLFDDISETELTRTGSQTSVLGSAESEPEAEEPVTPCISSIHSPPGTPSDRFCIVDAPPKTPIQGHALQKPEVLDNPWAKQQHSEAAQDTLSMPSDEQVARRIKSILNKLTMEKFESLSNQLVSCGLRSAAHAELLIHEIFEKATTQHHFVDMYADLCTFLHQHFTDHPCVAVAANSAYKEGEIISFKKLILDECQASFEMRSSLSKVDTDEVAALSYKTRMLGNIKLVGALLSRDMLAGKIGLIILEELLCSSTPESLECAALLLTTAGRALDRPAWRHHAALNHIFARIAELAQGNHCRARERFLLKDLLELRANCWVDHRPKKLERATTLKQVAQQANAHKQ